VLCSSTLQSLLARHLFHLDFVPFPYAAAVIPIGFLPFGSSGNSIISLGSFNLPLGYYIVMKEGSEKEW